MLAMAVGFIPSLQLSESGSSSLDFSDSLQLPEPMPNDLRPLGSDYRTAREYSPILTAIGLNRRFGLSRTGRFAVQPEGDGVRIRLFAGDAGELRGGGRYPGARAPPVTS